MRRAASGNSARQVLIDAVVHEGAAALGDDEAHVAQHLQVVGDGRLAEREVIGDVADADRLVTGGQQIEDADAGRIGQGLEPGGVRLRLGLRRRSACPGGCSKAAPGCDGRSFEGGRHEKTPSLPRSIVLYIDICQ